MRKQHRELYCDKIVVLETIIVRQENSCVLQYLEIYENYTHESIASSDNNDDNLIEYTKNNVEM